MQPGYYPQQPLPAQGQINAQAPQPQAKQVVTTTKFYKSGLFGFSSAAGRFQRDLPKMEHAGWYPTAFAFLGTNFWLQRTIGVTYQQR